MNKLVALQAFQQVAEASSFTAAAEQLQVSTAMVSKYVSELERELGTRLMTRSTRSVRLTEQGARYYQTIVPLLNELASADLEASAGSLSPRGELRLTAPIDLGERLLPGIISLYQQRYPEVTISLDLTDRQVDLFSEHYDLALRAGNVNHPDWVIRKLTTLALVLCASPEYLANNPPLNHPRDLADGHNCLLNPSISSANLWHFSIKGDPFSLRVNSSLQINSAQALNQAAINGQGIIYAPRILLQDALTKGLLVTQLDDFIIDPMDVFLVYPEREYLPAKVRCFIDTLLENYP